MVIMLSRLLRAVPASQQSVSCALAQASGSGERTSLRARGKAMDDASGEIAELDDFQVIAERRRVTETIAALTDRYRKLNQEMYRRETLRWMVR
jgi:hypothetical protein